MNSARELFEHETRSMYDGMKRLERGLAQIEKRTGETQLTKLIGELRAAAFAVSDDGLQRSETRFRHVLDDRQEIDVTEIRPQQQHFRAAALEDVRHLGAAVARVGREGDRPEARAGEEGGNPRRRVRRRDRARSR